MERIRQYDYIRVVVTLLVVLGHSTYYEMLTKYGGCSYVEYVNNLSIVFEITRVITTTIYMFHMELFMALSGALFYITYEKGITFNELVVKKAKRLLLPFIIVTMCYSVPLKYISGYYKESQSIIRDVIIGQVFIQGNTHLWFLLALFLIFIVVYTLEKDIAWNMSVKLMVLAVLSILSRKIDIVIISVVMKYTFWFYVGYCFEKHREKIDKKINVSFLFKVLFVTGIISVIYFYLSGFDYFICKGIKTIIKVGLSSLLCLCVYAISVIRSRKMERGGKLYDLLLRDSFGIYLYSDSWNYLILLWGTSFFKTAIFATDIGAGIFYVTRFLITLMVSIFVTEMIRKCKTIKYLY